MTIRMTVRTAVWRAHVASVAHAVDDLVPVVKGNGYGFGRGVLTDLAVELADTIAVGSIHELDVLDRPARRDRDTDVVVLTPTLTPPPSSLPVLTVGSLAHVEAARGWRGRVIVKVCSPMRRYGAEPNEIGALLDAATRAGLTVVGTAVHPPLAGSDDDHVATIVDLLDVLPTSLPVWISHLDPVGAAGLPATHTYRLRLGTTLWHGARHALHLDTDVLDVRPIAAGTPAGYRQRPAAHDGHLVMVGGGSANGVGVLPDGRSPFHFARRRVPLHEPPHMHTSMLLVPDGDPVPDVGARVDLQRPLTMTLVDEFVWL
jgi:alanine racemase